MRHAINFFITGALLWVFQLAGWIQVHRELAPFESETANQILVAGIIGLIFTVGLWLANFVFVLAIVGSCGIGCLLYPIYLAFLGPVGFWLVAELLPGWIEVSATTWHIILMGILISMIRIHSSSSSSDSEN